MDGDLWLKTQYIIDSLLADQALSINTGITQAGIPLDQQEEVRKYLEACRNPGSILSSPGISLLDQHDLTNRTIAGRYACVRKIGRGGFGDVWLAIDKRLPGKQVVLKFPISGLASTAAHERRLADEIEALAKLHHTGILNISDTGKTPDGRLFAVMDYIHGETLRQELTAGPWQTNRAIPVLLQLGKALEYAHNNNVLHLDLKPENIILRNTGTQDETAIIIDFGLGVVRGHSDISTDESRPSIAGSVGYLAPECFQSRFLKASDVYSLGIIACELLTGKHPTGHFHADLYLSLPSSFSLAVENVLLMATASEPTERYASISEFVDSLVKVLERGERRTTTSRTYDSPLSKTASRKQMEAKMIHTSESSDGTVDGFEHDVERLSGVRKQFGEYLSELADTLTDAEYENSKCSGALDLNKSIEDLRVLADHLNTGRFRFMILGDMNRGKSSILNVILRESVLPTAVTKCTAILTILRFGLDKRATVFFTKESGKNPDTMTLAQFRQRYTISAAEAEQYEKSDQHAFPDVTHAIIEHPLPLLEKGVEIVDTPGLNDTMERNTLALGFIRQCHAVLFVFDAINQVTLTEREYITNYLLGHGPSVFFLVNKWDHIRSSIVDPDNAAELKNAQDKVMEHFRSSLAESFDKGTNGTFEERVFPLSTLEAFRRLLKNPESLLEGTGVPPFLSALSCFLEKERLSAELQTVRLMASGIYRTVHEKIALRIPLLDQPVEEFKAKVDAVQPEFRCLLKIRDEFRDQIEQESNRKAAQLADSMRRFLGGLVTAFESDFEAYQPELRMLEFFSKSKREEFQKACKSGLDRYIMAKLAFWVKDAEQELRVSFANLSAKGAQYGQEYTRATNQISETLTGIRPSEARGVAVSEDESPGWTRWLAGTAAYLFGDIPGAVMAANGVFNVTNVLANVGGTIVISAMLVGFCGLALTPLVVFLPALGISGWQALRLKKKLTVAMREELEKAIPQIADATWEPVYKGIQECYVSYRDVVTEKIDADIHSRETELSNLLLQKQKGELDRTSEVERLRRLEEHTLRMWRRIEAVEAGQPA